jgi:hypothetical protein
VVVAAAAVVVVVVVLKSEKSFACNSNHENMSRIVQSVIQTSKC